MTNNKKPQKDVHSIAIPADGRLYLYPCFSSNHGQAVDIAVANHKQVWWSASLELLVHSTRFPRRAAEKPFAFCKGSSGSEWHGTFAQHLTGDGAVKHVYSALPSPRGDRQARRMRQ
jgi:hypothetical protein